LRIVITGGTGFVGRHLARRLVADGHDVVLVARGADDRDPSVRNEARFLAASIADPERIEAAFAGADAVIQLAGINRETGAQTFESVHIRGTRNVVEAARASGVNRIVFLSFLRARPGCGSAYHESKWAAEEIVRRSGLNHTVLKATMIHGRGDHMLDHISHALHTLPLFALWVSAIDRFVHSQSTI
jgi:uncharacterized protein YbjT (DUF2867 family)